MTASRRARLSFMPLLALGLLWSAAPSSLAAQAPQTDPEVAARVLLEAARQFEREGRNGVADAIYGLILERYAATAAAETARAERMASAAGVEARSGRVELQVWGTLYGIWLGAAVPGALGADSPEAYGVGLLLGAPGGLLLSRAVARSRALSEGQARAITWGGTWGTWQGFGWSEVFDIGGEEFCDEFGCYDVGDRTEEIFASMIVGGLAGAAVGSWIASAPVSSGVATGAHYGSLWGSWVGVASSAMADMGEDPTLTTTLLAGNAGLIAGGLLARRFGLTRDRIRLVSVGGLIGLLGGFGLDLIIQPDSDELAFGLPLALSATGLVVGAHLTRDRSSETGPAPSAGAGGPALLKLESDAWSWGLPVPIPTLMPVPDATGRERLRPGLAFSLISGRF